MTSLTVGTMVLFVNSMSVSLGFETEEEDIIVTIPCAKALKEFNGFSVDTMTVFEGRICLWLMADDVVSDEDIVSALKSV